MKKNLIIIVFCLITMHSYGQDEGKIKDLMQIGDSIVLTADTNLAICYKQDSNDMSFYLWMDHPAIFTYQGIDYRLSFSSGYYEFDSTQKNWPFISVSGQATENRNHAFSASISASLKRDGIVKVNPCKYSFASKGTRVAVCMYTLDAERCDIKTSSVNKSPCEWSASYEQESLAKAVLQFTMQQLGGLNK